MELRSFKIDEDPEKEKELNLAKLIKKEYCDDTGKETQPRKAAEIIHELGKLYRKRSPDKLSLIKSVGLFNAAIVRNPFNLSEVENDLSEVCQHILKMANAKVQSTDLLKKAVEVKRLFNELRIKVDQLLESLEIRKISTISPQAKNEKQLANNKISSVQQINQLIASEYKQIMSGVGQFCEDVMGKPPCEYAIAGMGSLARSEITPYSDFEHVILLNDDEKYQSYLEYFCWYSIIFNIIILNLQETVIYKLDIKVLNKKNFELDTCYFDAFTPEGISFDGMMPHASHFPLKRNRCDKNEPFEPGLIKPVSEMLKYLSSKADLKSGYPLSDILTRTCFVYGNQDVFNQFESGVENKRKQTPKPKRIQEVKQQVKDDLDNYSSRFRLVNLKSEDTINIKQLIYRSSTIFIAALGRIHNISANSSFEIVNEMQKIGEITKTTRDKLIYAIAIACEIRLKTYSKSKCQNDSPISLINDDETVNQLFEFVGAVSTVEYFQIAYCLQCEVAKQLNFTKLHFYSDPHIFNFKLGLIFDLKYLKTSVLTHRPKFVWDRNQFNFDKCIERLEKSVTTAQVSTKSDSSDDINLIKLLADHLYSINAHDDALEFYETTLENYKHKRLDEQNDGNIANILNNVGNCLLKMERYHDALIYSKQSLDIYRSISPVERKDNDIAKTLNDIGNFSNKSQSCDIALNHMEQPLEIKQNISLDEQKNIKIAGTLNNVGVCLMEMQRYDDAVIHLKQSLEIHQDISLDQRKDGRIGMTLNNLGNCLKEMQRYEDALIHLKQSLEIDQNISLDEFRDRSIAKTLSNVGLCLKEMQRYDDALIHLEQSLEIDRNTSLDERKDGNIANTLTHVGNCLMEMQRYDDALNHLKESLEIKQNISLDERKDGAIARTLNIAGNCLMEMQHYDDALFFLEQSLEIFRNISFDKQKDDNIANTLNNVGNCLMKMQRYDDAFNHLKQSLEVFQNLSPDEQIDGNIAKALNNSGSCLMEMQRYDDALIHLRKSLEIKQNISLDEQKDGNIASTLNNIGACLKKMQRYDDAFIHLKQSLKIYRNISTDERTDHGIAITLNNIGNCLEKMQRYDDAVIHLKQSLVIFQNITLNSREDGNIARLLSTIGYCMMKMQRFDDALDPLQNSLKIKRNISLDERKDVNIASILYNVGSCLMKMQRYDDALVNLKQSLEIKRTISLDARKDVNVAQTLSIVGVCLMEMQRNDDALIHWKQALEIKRNISLDE